MLIVRIFAAVAVLALVSLAAWSQEPTPTPAEAGREPQEQPAHTAPDGAQEQRGTPRNPFVIEIVPSAGVQKGTTQEANGQKDNSSQEGWLVGATIALVVVTVLVAGATIGLVCLGWRQNIHFARSERAYIKMSHVSNDGNPGATFAAVPGGYRVMVQIEIKNHGQSWSRLSEQIFRVDKWSVCRG